MPRPGLRYHLTRRRPWQLRGAARGSHGAAALNSAVGVFGGTFAPIHNGHLRLAIEVGERLQLAQVRIVPCATPPHRPASMVPAARRLHWVQLAVAGDPRLLVDDRELRRSGASYTYDTLAELRAALGTQVPLVLMVGADSASLFHTWYRWREILDLAHLVFVERPSAPTPQAPELMTALRDRQAPSAAALRAQPAGLWCPMAIPPLAISATRIRRLVAVGRSLRGLVPDAVLDDLTPEDLRLLSHDEDSQHC